MGYRQKLPIAVEVHVRPAQHGVPMASQGPDEMHVGVRQKLPIAVDVHARPAQHGVPMASQGPDEIHVGA
jgi:phosphotransferase system HPr-like phosphotransfer protein